MAFFIFWSKHGDMYLPRICRWPLYQFPRPFSVQNIGGKYPSVSFPLPLLLDWKTCSSLSRSPPPPLFLCWNILKIDNGDEVVDFSLSPLPCCVPNNSLSFQVKNRESYAMFWPTKDVWSDSTNTYFSLSLSPIKSVMRETPQPSL